MKITHIAIILTLGLVSVMAWLVMDARSDAKVARNKLDLYEHRGSQPDPDMQKKEEEILLKEMQNQKQRTAVTIVAPPPLPPAPAPVPAPVPTRSVTPPLSASSHIGAEALNAPPPLTPQQRVVMSAPAIAKVKEVHNEAGFVIITAGTSKKVEVGMKFALRRLDSVVGRIQVTGIESGEAVGDLVGHVPTGVTVEIGDEVIQDIPEE